MNFLLIGTIKSIIPLPYGLCLKVRETQIGGTSKNGHEVGTYDYTWDCIAQSDAIKKYVQNYFRVGAIVIINGVGEQSISKGKKVPNFQNVQLKIKTIDLWNMGDPLKRKIREKYNSIVMGDEKPDINNRFEDDF